MLILYLLTGLAGIACVYWVYTVFSEKPPRPGDQKTDLLMERIIAMEYQEAKRQCIQLCGPPSLPQSTHVDMLPGIPDSLKDFLETVGPNHFIEGEVYISLVDSARWADRDLTGRYGTPIGDTNEAESVIITDVNGRVCELEGSELDFGVRPVWFPSLWHYLLYRHEEYSGNVSGEERG